MDLASVADELYALPLSDFTGARNERAKEAKAEDKALGEAVKKLPKPSMAAWVVNMLVRHDAEQLTQVLELGASLREAQENLDGAELRELNKQRRQLTAAVTTRARGVAHDLGVKVSDAVADQVEETLRAAMTDEDAAKAVRTGQLLESLSATGLGDLDVSNAVAVPESIGMTAKPAEPVRRRAAEEPEKPQLSVVEEPEEEPESDEEANVRALEEARAVAAQAQEAAAKADKKLAKSKKRVAKLEARSLEVQGKIEELRRRLSDLEYELEVVDEKLEEAEDKRDRAQENDEKARAALDEAQAAVAELER